jgi:hypothetical protein
MAPTPPTSLVLSGATCLLYQMPLLYIWRHGEDVLYVGKSKNGIMRPLAARHEHLRFVAAADTLELLLRPYACAMGLLSEEARLIARLKPLRNRKRDPHHAAALKAHPDDCPPSGEHVQREREAAAPVRREREERIRPQIIPAAQQPDADGMWSVKAVAFYLGVSQSTVRAWIRAGLLPAESGRISDATLREILDHGLLLPVAV